ncbi:MULTISPECIES: PQQ-dependent dehydrogenase, methanol/ethanol family [unclassified Sphingobium]|uniref:PQQ-dependent dehydrogenase, methanol/ethanol family n=1 Tax=unclassified Sphingobium TaxID=2611147 RepID=UPI0035A62E2A
MADRTDMPTERGGRNWAGYGGEENEQHYSALSQINAGNVASLGLVWYHDIDIPPNAFSAPVVVDGILYFAAGYSVVQALDARTGKQLWRYEPSPSAASVAGEKMRGGWGIRGLTYGDGRIFVGTIDGRLLAIDAKTGKLAWSTMTIGQNDGRYISGPPTFFNGKVIIGHGGADFAPVRGYVTTYDARTGKQLWRFHTVPGNPADGFENEAMEMAAKTWTGQWWKFGGGGTAWNAITYDRKYNRIYIGTGNGAPWNQKIRSPGGGDNLFLCSIIALDADTGAYIWHYQTNPGETWDYNAAMDIEIGTIAIDGKPREVIMTAPKNGFFYVLDRATGKLISAEKFVNNVNWASHIDLKTGRPVENGAARFPAGREFTVYPSPVGAHSVEAMAFNPRSGLVYLNAIEQGRAFVDPPGDLKAWRFSGGQFLDTGVGKATAKIPVGTNSLIAYDPARQKVAWRVPLAGTKNGATMTTAGNLVFQGTVKGTFDAYAADSGKPLWSFDARTGVQAQAISYEAGGTQYVTVISGWRGSTAGGPGLSWDYAQQKRRVLTFALGGHLSLPPDIYEPMPFQDDAGFVVDSAAAARGADQYAKRCAICHGAGLNAGGTAPDLRKAAAPMSYEGLASVLHDGVLVENGMPVFRELTPDEIRELQAYIRREARAALGGGAAASAKHHAGDTAQ